MGPLGSSDLAFGRKRGAFDLARRGAFTILVGNEDVPVVSSFLIPQYVAKQPRQLSDRVSFNFYEESYFRILVH